MRDMHQNWYSESESEYRVYHWDMLVCLGICRSSMRFISGHQTATVFHEICVLHSEALIILWYPLSKVSKGAKGDGRGSWWCFVVSMTLWVCVWCLPCLLPRLGGGWWGSVTWGSVTFVSNVLICHYLLEQSLLLACHVLH